MITPRKNSPNHYLKSQILGSLCTLFQARPTIQLNLIRPYFLEKFAFARCLGKSEAVKTVCYWFLPHIQFSLTNNKLLSYIFLQKKCTESNHKVDHRRHL